MQTCQFRSGQRLVLGNGDLLGLLEQLVSTLGVLGLSDGIEVPVVSSTPNTSTQSSAGTRELQAGEPPSWPGLQTCASAAAIAYAPSSVVPWRLPPTAANRNKCLTKRTEESRNNQSNLPFHPLYRPRR